MKKTKKLSAVLIFVLVLALLSAPILAIAASNDWFAPTKNSSSTDQPIKYENLNLSDVAQEGITPEPLKPDEKAVSAEKNWYEYITYAAEPISEFYGDDNTKYVYYDPYDYSYGLIMEVKDTNVASGAGGTIPCEFTSANELSVSWSTTAGKHYDHTVEAGAEVMGGWESGLKLALTKLEATVHFTYSHNWGTNFENSVELSQTFSAVHFNSKGAPYQWKVVNYVVSMPLRVDVYKLSTEGEYVLDRSTYMLAPTIQGACRQYIINGVVYIEDWRTGEGVPLDDFWDEYLTPEKIKNVYENKLLPTSTTTESEKSTEGGTE